jgi:hypothetical protein
MTLDQIVERAIPMYDKDCEAGKCEKDCRLSLDYKRRMREWLKKEIVEYAKRSYTERLNYDKK